MLDAVEKWLKGLSANKNTGELKTANYNDKIVYVYMESNTYALVSYTNNDEGIFSVDKNEIM